MNFSIQVELPVRIRPEHPMTDEEIMRFCTVNEMLRVERDANGELILMSPTGNRTSEANAELTFQLKLYARETGAGAVFDSNGGFTLPDGSMLNPDAALIRWPRYNALSEVEKQRFAHICPDFVVELRSPSDRLAGLQAKMGLWIANGAELAWLIDPLRKVVEIYRPGRAPETLEGGSSVEGEGPVAGFVLDLGRIWN
jgi:Uma2 family endonuclease